jgi:alanyl-tRNA synthetase
MAAGVGSAGRTMSPAMKTTAELREGFLAFFEEKGHLRQPSWSLVPRPEDRSTLLTSAGMQPQMPYFLGREPPPAPLTTTVQKCFRTPDIDEVGLDGSHLTFFEMLGNFSFGQYFKEGAIQFATEFIRERLQLDWDRCWATVFAGDPTLGIPEDEVAIKHWLDVGMPRERIVSLPASENFWSVGGPGPCGPDSEIYWDWGVEHGCGEPDCQPGCNRCERFLEFWNLVFMELELHPDRTVTPLPKQNIDTGMGLERTAAILQDVMSVYDTDGYQGIMAWIAAESGVAYGDSPQATKAHRVLADHGRGMTFLVGDGVMPSNEGRGYVLRRIIRRAVLQGKRIGMTSPFLPGLAETVIGQMAGAYPELAEHRREIEAALAAEEERFNETIERGMKLFDDLAGRDAISGEDAFALAATYGFPIELTVELAEERGQPVDVDEYTRLMAEHREISRAGGGKGDTERAADFAAGAGFVTEFVGFERTEVLTQIGALQELEDGLFLAKLRESPFYAAGGGQVTDAGVLENEENGATATLKEAYRFGDDQALVFEGSGFAAGDRVRAAVPWPTRFPTMANHTATHLLHKALHEVIGEHATQAGSAVRPDKLRFDFRHGQPLTAEERAEVERRVNEKVFQNLPVRTYFTTLDEARSLGAMMLFGEKYGDEVRVVEVDDWSRELCGGTHVRSTAEVGPFVILSESSSAAGVRRIEAVSSGEAFALLEQRAREAGELRGELARLKKDAKAKPPAAAGPAAGGVELDFRHREGDVVVAEVRNGSGANLRDLSDRVRQQEKALVALLGTTDDGRAKLVVNVDPKVADRVSAIDVIRAAAPLIGGGGGGKPTLAEAGGKDGDRLADALDAGTEAILTRLA